MSQTMRKILLGFDVRARAHCYVMNRWSNADRDLYLLRPEIKWPLSVDETVWPSLFHYDEIGDVGMLNKIFATPQSVSHKATGLWPNLETMNAFLAIHGQVSMNGWVKVGVVLMHDDTISKSEYWNAVLDDVPDGTLPDDWKFLGYDIADQYMVSGLVNCGYTSEEKPDIQAKWSARLNDYGLLEHVDDAIEFRGITEQRASEHKPFYMYGIYCDL